jgi:Fanconi anemia group D2 protein
MYQNAFKCFDVFCKQEVVGALVTHVGSGSRPEVDAAFDVLSLLTRTNSAQMRRFDMFIKGILDYLEKLEVSQIRKLYTIVSILAQDEDSGIGDEMRTIIGKQLSHSTRKFRRIGIVGGVMMIKEFGRKSAADDFSMDVDKPMPVSPSPSQQLSTAKSLLDQVMSDGCRSADMTILFNDELSMVVKEGNLDPKFLRDLLAQATDTLEELYLIESSDPLPIGDAVLYEYKAGLDSADACAIALNLMPLVLKQYDSLRKGLVDRSSVMCLPSHFHLLRTCVSVVNGGDLGDIDALLGCPVVMCTSDQLLPESYQGLAESVKNSICLALYLCLNWYLESVCAFAAEEDMDMQWKVMKRLQNVIEVETQLESCIALTPSFIGFLHRVLGIEMETSISGHGSGKKSTTKNKSKTSANTTAASTTLEVTHDHTFTDKAPSSILDVVRQFYRPLSVEVFRVLSYEPIQRPLSQDSQESLIQSTPHVSEMIKVELSMVVFLLDNLYWKVFSALTTFGGKKGPHSKFAHYDSDMGPSPAELIKLVISLLPSLCQYVEASSSYFQTQSENNDGVEDMFDMESTEAKIHSSILSTTLKIFSTVLAWPKLTEQENKDIVSDMAHTLADRIGSSSASSVTRIFKRGLTYLKGFGSSMPTLSCAQCLVKCLVHFCKVDPGFTEEGREQVADLCIYLLKKSWSDFDKIQQHKEAIGVILKFSITWSKDPLQQIENVIQDNFVRHLEGGLVQDSPDKDSERCNEVYATFSVKTMSCYYQTLLVALVEAVKASLSTKPATVSAEVQDRGLAILAVAFKIFQMLVNLVKTTEKRPFLGAALKYGRLLVEAFLRQGMPLLYEVFRTKQDEVLVLLKSLQHSTRSLQHFCGHSKVQKDITLTNRVPGLKKSLETLLFRVKCLLTEHNCQEAFWVGNLKNRDIHGQEISSQLPPPVSPEPEEDTESAGTTTATPEGDQDEMEEVLSSDSE